MQLIDTHQHLILSEALRYSWTDGVPALAGRGFTPEDYGALTKGRGVVGTLFMESGVDDADYRDEARLVAGLVGTGGMLGQIASCRPEVEAGFEDWLEECAGLQVRGFRRILHVVPDDVSQGSLFRSNLRLIGARGLPFDLCVLARQHGLTEDLLRACPDQVMVLDHCGNPDIAAGAFEPWAAGLRRLAAFPNLYIKLSGITANCAGAVTADLLRPYVAHVIDCFGPERVLWGGDWPVVNIRSSLPEWIELTEALLAGLTPEERLRIGRGTAEQVYGL